MILLSTALALAPRAYSQTNQTANVKIVSYSYYIDMSGYLDVVGEVQNVGSNTLTNLIVTGSAYSPDGTDQGDSYAPVGIEQIAVTYLAPQQKAPFYMTFYTPNNSQTGSWYAADISKVDLAVAMANATANYQYPDLKVTSDSHSIGTTTTGNYPDKGAYWVYANVENTGSRTAENVTLLATFYNSTGNVVAVGSSITPVSSILPSSTSSFKLGAFDLNQSLVSPPEKISSYSLLIHADGPVLQGAAPVNTPYPTSASSPSSNPTSTSTSGPSSSQSNPSTSNQASGNSPTSFLSPTLIVIIIVIVIIAAIGTTLALRKSNTKQTTKEKIRSRRQQNKP
jgi:hypothetical protein